MGITKKVTVLAVGLGLVTLSACGSSDDGGSAGGGGSSTVTLVSHNSWAVSEDVVAAWYSGICDTDRGETLVAFTGALLWNALDYTKPFGSCGGETGYWAEPPQG